MATRGHVQDPNDRRLRPIYGSQGHWFTENWQAGRSFHLGSGGGCP
uniref:N(alpha)-acetyltransferase 25, NatB auxiliary subunit n=1 Tax=Mus musculus TaxID=10090 RepID=G3UZX9_MOUSE